MKLRVTTTALAALTAIFVLAFAYVLRQISTISVGLAAHDEVEQKLRESLDDQKKLAELEPAREEQYRRRFQSTAELIGHLRVLALSRGAIRRRIEVVLLVVGAMILGSTASLFMMERRRIRAKQEKRLQYLDHLTAWQEAARRHAHEIRTPLTVAQMEVERLAAVVSRNGSDAEIGEVKASIFEELDRLRQFTRSFTSFASLPVPNRQPVDLRMLVRDFCVTFAEAWPGMELALEHGRSGPTVLADREMLRQVLVNLCTNSALAGAKTMRFQVERNASRAHVDMSDDGSGVAPELRRQIFEPYVTTRRIGEGMGLGLPISKKILLDHDGDLELVAGRATETTFRLTLPLETHD